MYEVVGILKNEGVNVFIGVYDDMDTTKIIVKECNIFFKSIQINEVMYNRNTNKILNEVCTTDGYIKEGFTMEEVALIREHDVLYNTSCTIGLSDKEKMRLYDLVDILKI